MERTKKKIDMDYEKKYNEALGWMRQLYPCLYGQFREDAEHFFPNSKRVEINGSSKNCKAFLIVTVQIISALMSGKNSTHGSKSRKSLLTPSTPSYSKTE